VRRAEKFALDALTLHGMDKKIMVPDASKPDDFLVRFMNRELFGMPMAVIACAVGAVAVGCLLALNAAGR
jgi:hypothetical protein